MAVEQQNNSSAKTLYDKIYEQHVVVCGKETTGTDLIYIDRHLVHEVTSPQAFEALRNAKRPVRRPDCTLATVDHNTPTSSRATYKSVSSFIKEPDSRVQCMTLEENVQEFGLTYFGLDDKRQGIVHVIGPEQGFTLPGSTVVCGDSHTATHGAFGALAFGIGTSEVEHVLATQTLLQKKSKNMIVAVDGKLSAAVTSKDVILHIIGVIGTAGGTGHVIEFAGDVFAEMSMEARMSVCNMAIEAGARAGMIAPDQITFDYLSNRPLAPKGQAWKDAVLHWQSLKSEEGAHYDKTVRINADDIAPTVTWGTSPQDVVAITGNTPDPSQCSDAIRKAAIERSLNYMGLEANQAMESIKINKVFIGSCTNSRIEDLRAAAAVVLTSGRKVAKDVYAMIVPGSGLVKLQAEQEGLNRIFSNAGFDWREAGYSMCLGMNPDQLKPGERCASTSNRNFEGRQGPGGRTHLVSPAMAAAAALTGHLTDVRTIVSDTNGKSAAEARQEISLGATDSKSYLNDCVVLAPPPPNPPSTVPGTTANIAEASPAIVDTAVTAIPSFTVLEGIPAPLLMHNIDTDMIIPKQFLKTIKRTGLGKSLFFELRYDPVTMAPKPNFTLNVTPYDRACILIAGENFGCGSSREHAPWALRDFGIVCVIAPSFADIFFNNCFKNGMLPIALPAAEIQLLSSFAREHPGSPIRVDLVDQKITILPTSKASEAARVEFAFEVEPFRKHCLVNGLDDIGLTMQKSDHIADFERRRSETYPWLDGVGYTGKNSKRVIAVTDSAADNVAAKAKLEW